MLIADAGLRGPLDNGHSPRTDESIPAAALRDHHSCGRDIQQSPVLRVDIAVTMRGDPRGGKVNTRLAVLWVFDSFRVFAPPVIPDSAAYAPLPSKLHSTAIKLPPAGGAAASRSSVIGSLTLTSTRCDPLIVTDTTGCMPPRSPAVGGKLTPPSANL